MPKSASVHHLDGTYKADRHRERLANEQDNTEQMPESSPVKPTAVKGKAVKKWTRLIELLPWLTEADSTALGQYVCLSVEWERDTDHFTAAKLAAMRKLEADLGMTLISRGKFTSPTAGNNDGHFND